VWPEKTQTAEKMISFKITTARITVDTERALRIATEAIWVQMRQRIFFDGLKSNGSPIGIYSPSYLIYRQQPEFGRTADPRIILVLTDSLRLNFVFGAIDAKTYGIGINGAFNLFKAQKNDPNQEIFVASQREIQIATDEFTKNLL
jgi:hypothetical protein